MISSSRMDASRRSICWRACFLPTRNAVALEDPVYHGLVRVFSRAGANILSIPVDDAGMDVDAFEDADSAAPAAPRDRHAELPKSYRRHALARAPQKDRGSGPAFRLGIG